MSSTGRIYRAMALMACNDLRIVSQRINPCFGAKQVSRTGADCSNRDQKADTQERKKLDSM